LLSIKKYLPSKIASHSTSYELLFRLYNDLKTYRNQQILISFKNVTWVEANLTSILGALIEDLSLQGNIINFIEFDNFFKKSDILIRNGFADYYKIQHNKTSFNNYNTHLPYKVYNSNNQVDHINYVKNEIIASEHFPNEFESEDIREEIKTNICEIFVNAQTHGECENIHVCGQFYPLKKNFNITIVDSGVTIKNNVHKYIGNPNISASDCINWAMIMNNTTKNKTTPGGIGLGELLNHIKDNDGRIQVISSNGFWEYYNGSVTKYDMNFNFEGTIVNIMFNLSAPYSHLELFGGIQF
jgi:hypothetical protein